MKYITPADFSAGFLLSLFHHKILKMYSSITQNIKVSVIPEYDVKNSFPADNRFVFRYNIVIENLGNDAVKLMLVVEHLTSNLHKKRFLILETI